MELGAAPHFVHTVHSCPWQHALFRIIPERDVFKVYLSPLTSVLLRVRLKSPTTYVLCQRQFHCPFKETEDCYQHH